jgi:hypothetical protein
METGDILDHLADVFGGVPSFITAVPVALAERALIVVMLQSVPVNHQGRDLGETSETICVLEILGEVDCVRRRRHRILTFKANQTAPDVLILPAKTQ